MNDHNLILEAYNKVLNEIQDMSPEEGSENKEKTCHDFIQELQNKFFANDYDALAQTVKAFDKYLTTGQTHQSHDEEPFEDKQGTGQYISNKQKSQDHKNDFMINRMNMKVPKDHSNN
jgi:hypothetical protein